MGLEKRFRICLYNFIEKLKKIAEIKTNTSTHIRKVQISIYRLYIEQIFLEILSL
jgi:hypothetical protein